MTTAKMHSTPSSRSMKGTASALNTPAPKLEKSSTSAPCTPSKIIKQLMSTPGGSRINEEKIFVTVHLRPLSNKELTAKDQVAWECVDNNTIVFKASSQDRSNLPSLCTFAKRQVGETSLNDTSLRSHQIIRLTIESKLREKSGCVKSFVANLNLVDLTTSERASQTHADGLKLMEGSHINRSLLTLTTVIRKLIKRVSGFNMAPPAAALMYGVTVPSQSTGTGTTPAMPGTYANMVNPLVPGQASALAMMPMQAMTQQATRHARRVYVGGLSPSANEQSVATFFSQVMSAIGGNTAGPGDAVVNVYINHEKKFAFVEMRSVEEATNAMALDGIIFEGAPVKVRRPSDYNPSLAASLGPSQPNPNLNLAAVGLTPGSSGGLEGPDRIFVGGLPHYFTESQVRELLESFGPLRGFDLVKDRETGNSKGYAFCVYQDLSVTDIACAALNGIKMGDKTLTVRRANQGTVQPRPEQEIVLLQAHQQVAMQRLVLQAGSIPTKVVCLTQVVSPDELKDDEEYEDILDDMRGEGAKYGNLVNIIIPRPGPNGELGPGVGKVFLEYADTDGSAKAKAGLHGRKFGGNQVVAVFYPEDKFAQGEYDA